MRKIFLQLSKQKLQKSILIPNSSTTIMWHTLLLCAFLTLEASQAWEFNEYMVYHELNCHKNECNLTMDVRLEPTHDWYPVLVRVSLGHTMKVDEGKVEVYNVPKAERRKSQPEIIINERNIWAGSILEMRRRYGQTIACDGHVCHLDCCVARGYAKIKKNYIQDDKPEIYVEWEPMIAFTQLWFGPKIAFNYQIKNGVVGDLKANPWIQYWGHCHEPHKPYDSSYSIQVPLKYH